MKFISALVVFFLALAINVKSVAAGADPATCTPETAKNENCTNTNDNSHGNSHGSDWSHKRHDQVRSIFPEKTKEAGKDVRPAKVNLVTPKFLAKVSAQSVKLEWTAVEGATHYHIQISKDAGFNNRSMYAAEDKRATGTTFEVKDLEPGVKYFWRVAAYNDNQAKEFTKSAFSFSSFETTK